MAENREEKILRDMNRVLEKILKYYYDCINSLTDKAGRFLSFSMIINSFLAGYVGAIFLLFQLRVTVMNLVLNYILYCAIACLIGAILCLLITGIIGARSLSPKNVAMPISEDIEEMKTLHISFRKPTEWYVKHKEKLVDAIKDNANLSELLARNVRIIGILITLATAFSIGFIILTLIFALGNITLIDC